MSCCDVPIPFGQNETKKRQNKEKMADQAKHVFVNHHERKESVRKRNVSLSEARYMLHKSYPIDAVDSKVGSQKASAVRRPEPWTTAS